MFEPLWPWVVGYLACGLLAGRIGTKLGMFSEGLKNDSGDEVLMAVALYLLFWPLLVVVVVGVFLFAIVAAVMGLIPDDEVVVELTPIESDIK